jgi:uncharacterized protein (TIGR02118 family)
MLGETMIAILAKRGENVALEAFNRDLVDRAKRLVSRRSSLYLKAGEAAVARRLGLPEAHTFDALILGEGVAGFEGAIYRVDARTMKSSDARPAIVLVAPVHRSPSITQQAFDAHWKDCHAPLALRHHVGMSEYVQCVVREIASEGAPAIDGIALLGFPSREAFERGFIDSKEGGRIIAEDTARFMDVSRWQVALTTEHIVAV